MRFVYMQDADGYIHDARFVDEKYLLQGGEIEGHGDSLPGLGTMKAQALQPTLADVIAVLPPDQQAALASRVKNRT